LEKQIKIENFNVNLRTFDTVIVGSGAAAFACAVELQAGNHDFCLVTEGLNMGTSRNTGSDKQTYYKISLSGKFEDSVDKMAQDLFAGGCMHGDTALNQAANSARAFFRLVELGVPFPTNDFGEFVGYQTDHDMSRRAVSAGPLTSRYMVEKLEDRALKNGLTLFDNECAVKLFVEDNKIKRAFNGKTDSDCDIFEAFTLYLCNNVVLATGGPAELYRDSVYPKSQTGSLGFAFDAGTVGANLTEWQYGIASKDFRWNLSGSFQQVLPRYFSLDENGHEEEFLLKTMTEEEVLNLTFLKGYQWPFDAKKALNGSSKIDIAVFNEIQAGKRVFLDFRNNPLGPDFDFSILSDEGREYLAQADALKSTPCERLKKLNIKAYQLYKNNGYDLEKQALEICVAAQHCNGGLAIDKNCQTNIEGLFAIGEAAATFGIYRPGGSALNATQVDALLAAKYINKKTTAEFPNYVSENDLKDFLNFAFFLIRLKVAPVDYLKKLQNRMSKYASFIRSMPGLEEAIKENAEDLATIESMGNPGKPLPKALREYDLLLTEKVFLFAMKQYIKTGGLSRGAYLIFDEDKKEYLFGDEGKNKILQVKYSAGDLLSCEIPVRPIPIPDDKFENLLNLT